MKPQFLSFNSTADQVITDATVRSAILAAGIALAVANSASLPSSQANGATNYFNLQVKADTNHLLSHFNENVVFDIRAAVDHVQTYWMIRYTAAYPSRRVVYSDACGFFDCLNGVNLHVSEEKAAFLNTHKRAILLIAAAAAEVIDQICEAEASAVR